VRAINDALELAVIDLASAEFWNFQEIADFARNAEVGE
jgi:hypothetical protein